MATRNYGAKAGEQIVGSLYRGGGGKFQSGPSDAGLKKLGITRDLSDSLINSLASKPLTPEQTKMLTDGGYLDSSGIMTKLGRSLALSLKSKNLTAAAKLLKPPAAKKKAGAKGKAPTAAQIKLQNRTDSKATVKKAGLSQAEVDAFFDFVDGVDLDEKMRDTLASRGLLTVDSTGAARLSSSGRALDAAMGKNDPRKIQDAISTGRDAAAKLAAKTKKEVTEMDMENTELEEMCGMGGYVPYGITSFAQLEKTKAVAEMQESMIEATQAFTTMVSNIVGGESEDKLGEMNTLFAEYTDIITAILGGVGAEDSEDEEGYEDQAQFEIHHTATTTDAWQPKAAKNGLHTDLTEGYAYAYAFLESSAPTRYSYHFQHHDGVDAPANIRAVNHALVELYTVPDEDRVQVERHLRAHRLDAGLTEAMSDEEVKTAVSSVALMEGYDKATKAALQTAVTLQESEFTENHTSFDVLGTAVSLQESAAADSPLHIDVRLIKPGWGNKRDNNYYPQSTLKRDAGIFKGVKMHVTNHDLKEHNDRYWVSTITEAGDRFDESGAPIVRVAVHEPWFAQRVRNLNELGLLDKLQCSIVANGRVKQGFEEGGRRGAIVEGMTEARSVDWVTRAGAGGAAMNLIENYKAEDHMPEDEDVEVTEQETKEVVLSENEQTQETAVVNEDNNTQETAVVESGNTTEGETFLSEAEVQATLHESSLPDIARERIIEGTYADKDSLQQAITREQAYLTKALNLGKPENFTGESNTATVVEYDPEKESAAFEEIFEKFGL